MRALAWLRRNPDLAAMVVIAAMAALISMARGVAIPDFVRMEPVTVDIKPRVMTIQGHSREALREAQDELRRTQEEMARQLREHHHEMREEAQRVRGEAHHLRDSAQRLRDEIRRMAHAFRDEVRSLLRRESRISRI